MDARRSDDNGKEKREILNSLGDSCGLCVRKLFHAKLAKGAKIRAHITKLNPSTASITSHNGSNFLTSAAKSTSSHSAYK